jgi:hypothetical protein
MEWCEKHSPFRFDLSCLQHANFKPGLRPIYSSKVRRNKLSSSGTEGTVALEQEKEASQADFLFGLKRFGAAQTRKRKLIDLRHWAISLLVRWKSKWKASQQTKPGARRHSERGKVN